MKAHIFNIDTVIKVKQQVWVIDKTKPSIPLLKIETSDLSVYQSGIFRSHGNEIKFNGTTYWLPNELVEKLKVKVKNIESKMSNLGLSLQEFLNKDVIDNLEFSILVENIDHLKNSPDDIYIICSKKDRVKYEKFLKTLQEKLAEIGVQIKAFYHINERFYNQSDDDIAYNKIKLVVQHLIGLRTENKGFSAEEITKYEEVYFYDDSTKAIALGKSINKVIDVLVDNTKDEGVKLKVQDSIKSKPIAHIVQVTSNKIMKFISNKVELKLEEKLIKTYESFRKSINQPKG
jgi:hypothetical protein